MSEAVILDESTAGILDALEQEASALDQEAEPVAGSGSQVEPERGGWFRAPLEPSPESAAIAEWLAGAGVGAVHSRLGITDPMPGQEMAGVLAGGLAPVVEKYKGEPPAWLKELVNSYREEIGLAVVLASVGWQTWHLYQAEQARRADAAASEPVGQVAEPEPVSAAQPIPETAQDQAAQVAEPEKAPPPEPSPVLRQALGKSRATAKAKAKAGRGR